MASSIMALRLVRDVRICALRVPFAASMSASSGQYARGTDHAEDFYMAVADAVSALRGGGGGGGGHSRGINEEVMTLSAATRTKHAEDEGASKILGEGMGVPGAVVFPRTTEEVSTVLRMCNENEVPVVPYGVGTSLEGHIAPVAEKRAIPPLTINLRGMNKVLEVNAEDGDVLAEAGVTRMELNAHLRDSGHFFSVDPGADATLGGMASCRASGTTAVRYGTMRDVTMGVTAVLPDGSVAHCGGRSRKRSNGYDLTGLMVGSEGTLGVITELRLRLFPIPDKVSAATCYFDTMEGCVNSVTETLMMGLPVARIELMDDVQVRAINQYSGFSMPELPTIFYEFHGDAGEEAAATAEAIAKSNGGGGFAFATKQEDRTRLWSARHTAYYAAQSLRPGERMQGFPTDVCVPLSELAPSILETKRDLDENGIIAPIVGHVGDGNYHCLCLVNLDDEDEKRRWKGCVERMVLRAIEVGGTCSGEHGIGHGKLKYLRREHGDVAVDAMHAIKKALDPNNIMNPGKLGSHIPYNFS